MTRPPRPALLVTLLTVAALVLGGCGGVGSTGDKGYVDGKGVITRLGVADRTPVGDLSGETLDGKQISLADLRGTVVVVNVWGSWCPPCRKEAPTLVAAAKELAPRGVQFLGIDSRDASPAQGLAFQRRYEVPYPSIYDPSGRTLLAFRGTLSPNAIPSTVVIDARGRVAASIVGEVPSRRTLVELVSDVAS